MTGMFLSVDFEDFSHDMKRQTGIWKTGEIRVDELWRKYNLINAFLARRNSKATFFCVGMLADQAPDLISQIAKDGHEVACHFLFHDDLAGMTTQQVDSDFSTAVERLEAVTNSKVLGFRAPRFNISKTDPEQYRLVEKHFAYDSSFFCNNRAALAEFKRRMGLTSLVIFPIFEGKIGRVSVRVKSGGTYFKLLPVSLTADLFNQCEHSGLHPHLYVHPYEIGSGAGFRIRLSEMQGVGWAKRLYLAAKQSQWLNAGNAGVMTKLNQLSEEFPLKGRLCDHLATEPHE